MPFVGCRLGSFFEPVDGCKFDLVVCNPPFVISPESEYVFRDGGLPSDQLSEQVVRDAAACLNEGGFASILCNWAQCQEEDWSLRARQWVERSGCDAYLLRGETRDPLGYAALWNEGYAREVLAKRLDQWVEYYRKLGIKALTVGAVILRRRASQRNWIRTDEFPRKFMGSCSDDILRVIHAEDFLAGLATDDDLFEQTFTTNRDYVLHQTVVHEAGKSVVQKIEIELPGGLSFHGNLDTSSVQLLRRCNGRRKLREIVDELAALGRSTFAQVRDQAVHVVRELIRCGFLVAVSGTEASGSNSPGGGPGADAASNTRPA